MDAERWKLIRSVLDAALSQDEAVRAVFLDERCQGDAELRAAVESLLCDRTVRTDPPPSRAETAASTSVSESGPGPSSIGDYVILGKLGEGGMGVVYEAEQRHPKRKVALKVVHGGRFVDETSLKLFQREAETLGRLRHPHIGAIYESGRTEDGQHFFAMELVRGETLGEQLRHRAEGDLPTDEIRYRLGLFRTICDAVNYAHQRGVIHRDLKPSNIVVSDDGAVKVLDFGLARITDADTGATTMLSATGAIRGTLPYMSPEQARGNPHEIDLRTDVYSLGVILYEMLSQRRPLDPDRSSILEAVRVICEDRPPPLREAMRRADSDLETIVGKALEKDAERRYASAAAFSEDVERYLAKQPILARPPSTVYQLKKLVARNRLPFAFAAAVAVMIAGFGVWMSVLYTRADGARRESEAVTGFLSDMLGAVDPGKQGRDVTVREVLDEAAGKITEEFSGQPLIEARLQSTVGTVYKALGHYGRALTPLERALAIRERRYGPGDLSVAESLSDLGNLKWNTGDHPGAKADYERALAILERTHGREHPDVARMLEGLAIAHERAGELEEAVPIYERALAMREKLLGPDHPDVANTLSGLAIVLKDSGDLDGARPLYERALAILRGAPRQALPLARVMANYAELLRLSGEADAARPLFEESLVTFEKALGPEHNEVAMSLNSNAIIRAESGDFAGAQAYFERALAIHEKVLPPLHRDVAQAAGNLGYLHQTTGNLEEARSLMERAVAIYEETLPSDNPLLAGSRVNLALLYLEVGEGKRAEPLLESSLAVFESSGGSPADVAMLSAQLARLKRSAGDSARARSLLERALALREEHLDPDDPLVVETLEETAGLLRENGEVAAAATLEERARAIRATEGSH